MGLLAAWTQVFNSLRQLASALNDANGDPGHRCRWEPDEEGTLAAPQPKAPRRALVDPNISSNTENVPAAPALSLTFGPSAVRAEPDSPTPSWREMLLDPIMTAVHTVEARLSGLEASIALSAGFFKSQQIATQKLCVYDNTGETCITKAQLDAVLASMARAAAAAPANAPPAAVAEGKATVIEPSVTVTEAPTVVTEAPAAVTDEGKATVIEPSVTVTEAPAVVTEAPAIVTEAKAQDRFEQALAETTSIVTAVDISIPAPAASDE